MDFYECDRDRLYASLKLAGLVEDPVLLAEFVDESTTTGGQAMGGDRG